MVQPVLSRAESQCCDGIGMSPNALEEHSVVVVGAGLAGLYAAKLLQPHFKDVLVLEATDRPGGRVRQASIGSVHRLMRVGNSRGHQSQKAAYC